MSIISSSLVVFLLCSISFHACNARHLGAIGKEPEKKSLLPNKNDDKVMSPVKNTSVAPKFKPALSKELGATNGESMAKQSRVDKDDHNKPISSKAKKLKDQKRVKVSGASQTNQSLRPASPSLHHQKPGEQHHQPGFNLDYLPPMTFPPVHN